MLGLTAEQIGAVLLGFSIFISTLWGGRAGKQALSKEPKATSNPVEFLEVNAAVINPAVAAEMVHAVRENTQAVKELTDVVDVLGEKMDDLKIEIIRGNRK